jgi:hypothetical protein
MTDFNPFAASSEEPAVYAQDGDAEAAGNSSRKTYAALGALAAVVLGAGAFLFLGGSGDEELLELPPVKRAPLAAPAAAGPSAAPVAKLPAKSTLTLGRNPFRALYIQPPPPEPEPATEVQAPAAPGVIVVNPGGNGTTPPSGGAAPAPQQPTAKEHKLVLLRVFGTGKDQSASFSIDDKQQTAKVGTTFGPTAEILLLSLQEGPKEGQWTAVLQVGDGDPFDVILGEPVFVR